MNTVELAIAGVGALGPTLAAGFAVFIYSRDSRAKRADWLHDLFRSFYAEDRYRRIRVALDFKASDDFAALTRDVQRDQNSDLHEAFVDYLNFFEMMLGMCRLGLYKRAEIDLLFEYYIRCLGKHPFILDYARSNGFEHIAAELSPSLFVRLNRARS